MYQFSAAQGLGAVGVATIFKTLGGILGFLQA